jgi:hypothetical protein
MLAGFAFITTSVSSNYVNSFQPIFWDAKGQSASPEIPQISGNQAYNIVSMRICQWILLLGTWFQYTSSHSTSYKIVKFKFPCDIS